MAKIISYDKDAREKLLEGVKKVVQATSSSLGPKGCNTVIGQQYGSPTICNDGVTIAKAVELKDPLENAGCQLVKDIASKTNDAAGDGTTTASVLGLSILEKGLQKIEDGCNPIQMKEGINKAVRDVIEFIKEKSVEVDNTTLQQVATVSAGNNEEIGELIAKAINQVGCDGIVTVEEGTGFDTTLKSADGLLIDKGYISPYFVTDDEKMECILEKPLILAVNKKLNIIQDLIPTLNVVAQRQTPLLIVAEDVEGEALASLVVNTMRKVVNVCAIKASGFGDSRKNNLEDLCALTGATLWTEELGIDLGTVDPNINPEFYGKASRVKVTKDDTTVVVTEKSKRLDTHISSLKAQLEQAENEYDKEKLTERIAKLTGGVAVIQVGAATETELKDKKLRIEDALNATRAAQAEGIVAGGGYTLLEAQEKFSCDIATTTKTEKDRGEGYNLLIDALSLPAKLIAENAGCDGDAVIKTCKEKKLGYNALTDSYEDLLKTGVIDPAKVTRSALENAASIAGMLLTTKCAIVDEPQKDGDVNAFQPQGQPMMM